MHDLVNHVVRGNLWVRELGSGRTIDEVGDRFDGDVLGENPVATSETAMAGAIEAFAGDDAMDRLWELSFGSRPGRVYARHRFIDVLIHSWDIASASRQPAILPDELVAACTEIIEARPQLREKWGFADVGAPSAADPQTKLLALAGRRSLVS